MKKMKLSYGEMLDMAVQKGIDPTQLPGEEVVNGQPEAANQPVAAAQAPVSQPEAVAAVPGSDVAQPVKAPKGVSYSYLSEEDEAMAKRVKEFMANFECDVKHCVKSDDWVLCRIPRKQHMQIMKIRMMARVNQFKLLGAIVDRFIAELEAGKELDKIE